MHTKDRNLTVLLLLSLLLVGCARQVYEESATRVDMIVYFHPNTAVEEEQQVWTEALNVAHPKSGYDFAPGIVGVYRCQSPPDKGAICVDFAPNASQEEVDNIRRKVAEWPQVRTVLFDVIPLQVTETDLIE